jgi:hypothetical protein
MLEFLEGRASERKLRLFAVACCRRLHDLLWDPALGDAIRVAEACADHRRSKSERVRAWNKAERLRPRGLQRQCAQMAVASTIRPDPFMPGYVAQSAMFALADLPEKSRTTIHRLRRGERTAQVHLLRDIIGNPFRPATLDPTALTWNGGTVPKMAQVIYDDRAFDRLPILADALEEAGCTDADILAHCRSEGPHVRGCWVVDLILGKS